MPKPNEEWQESDRCRFRKGNPGGGRPKGLRRIVDDIYGALAEVATSDELAQMFERLDIPEGLRAIVELAEDRQKAFAQVLVFRMLRGDSVALDAVLSRVAPAPKHVELSGRGGGPIRTANTNAQVTSEDAETEYFKLLYPEHQDDDPEAPDHPDD